MKGLLIKDLKLMKNQKSFFMVMAVVGLIFLITWDAPYFAISYITMMFSMFAITSFSYDEFDNGAVYLFTLPFSRKTYVREKYLFGLLTCLIALTVSTVLAIGAKCDQRAVRGSCDNWCNRIVIDYDLCAVLKYCVPNRD